MTDHGDSLARPSWLARMAEGSLLLLRILRARPQFAIGYAIVFSMCAIALLAPWIAPYDPVEASPAEFLQPPSVSHWLASRIRTSVT